MDHQRKDRGNVIVMLVSKPAPYKWAMLEAYRRILKTEYVKISVLPNVKNI